MPPSRGAESSGVHVPGNQPHATVDTSLSHSATKIRFHKGLDSNNWLKSRGGRRAPNKPKLSSAETVVTVKFDNHIPVDVQQASLNDYRGIARPASMDDCTHANTPLSFSDDSGSNVNFYSNVPMPLATHAPALQVSKSSSSRGAIMSQRGAPRLTPRISKDPAIASVFHSHQTPPSRTSCSPALNCCQNLEPDSHHPIVSETNNVMTEHTIAFRVGREDNKSVPTSSSVPPIPTSRPKSNILFGVETTISTSLHSNFVGRHGLSMLRQEQPGLTLDIPDKLSTIDDLNSPLIINSPHFPAVSMQDTGVSPDTESCVVPQNSRSCSSLSDDSDGLSPFPGIPGIPTPIIAVSGYTDGRLVAQDGSPSDVSAVHTPAVSITEHTNVHVDTQECHAGSVQRLRDSELKSIYRDWTLSDDLQHLCRYAVDVADVVFIPLAANSIVSATPHLNHETYRSLQGHIATLQSLSHHSNWPSDVPTSLWKALHQAVLNASLQLEGHLASLQNRYNTAVTAILRSYKTARLPLYRHPCLSCIDNMDVSSLFPGRSVTENMFDALLTLLIPDVPSGIVLLKSDFVDKLFTRVQHGNVLLPRVGSSVLSTDTCLLEIQYATVSCPPSTWKRVIIPCRHVSPDRWLVVVIDYQRPSVKVYDSSPISIPPLKPLRHSFITPLVDLFDSLCMPATSWCSATDFCTLADMPMHKVSCDSGIYAILTCIHLVLAASLERSDVDMTSNYNILTGDDLRYLAKFLGKNAPFLLEDSSQTITSYSCFPPDGPPADVLTKSDDDVGYRMLLRQLDDASLPPGLLSSHAPATSPIRKSPFHPPHKSQAIRSSGTGLPSCPSEIWDLLLCFLPVKDILTMCLLNHRWCVIATRRSHSALLVSSPWFGVHTDRDDTFRMEQYLQRAQRALTYFVLRERLLDVVSQVRFTSLYGGLPRVSAFLGLFTRLTHVELHGPRNDYTQVMTIPESFMLPSTVLFLSIHHCVFLGTACLYTILAPETSLRALDLRGLRNGHLVLPDSQDDSSVLSWCSLLGFTTMGAPEARRWHVTSSPTLEKLELDMTSDVDDVVFLEADIGWCCNWGKILDMICPSRVDLARLGAVMPAGTAFPFRLSCLSSPRYPERMSAFSYCAES
ncbi:hypothetical protein BDZ89DRAFT_1147993 [Hymenopellis radicata]|nr:hypothetical protein BDZ89DRAFT_1147993 [Hymenopellis radicata]